MPPQAPWKNEPNAAPSAQGGTDRDRSSPAKFRLGDDWRVDAASWREGSDSADPLRGADETELEKPQPIDPILTQLGGLDFGVER
ncbi:MAG: hypothetical protein EXS13_11290 [Planctomycetes bacterium]|nr:hypothetical protein [Planctomycetota bacterium]